jgi:hypothetical protein
MIHDLDYVMGEQHGDYVLESKQDRMPSRPSKPNQVGVLAPNEIIDGNIP